jgi:hypothetical protein
MLFCDLCKASGGFKEKRKEHLYDSHTIPFHIIFFCGVFVKRFLACLPENLA